MTAAMERLGGVATRAEVIAATSRRDFDQGVMSGAILRVARGRYALPTASEARRVAHELKGTAILLSAAAHWGWKTKWQPRQPQVAVVRGRKLTAGQRARAQVSWVRLPGSAVNECVTTPVRTVLDCAARGPRGRVGRVVEAADGRAANPFESVLRAIALDVPGLQVEPQVRIDRNGRWVGRVDLADQRLKIVLEADSYEFHGEGELFEKDCVRYDELVADGWLVLRFPWKRVMARPEWVREIIEATVALRIEELVLRGEHGTGLRPAA